MNAGKGIVKTKVERLELRDDTIFADGNPIINNLRFNIEFPRQGLRLKFNIITDDGVEEPIDLLIIRYSISIPSIELRGEELNRGIPFKLVLSLQIPKFKICTKGTIGCVTINRNIDTPSDFLTIIKSAI